jgi:hypothetical protein
MNEEIFRRLRSVGADWVYHFPQLYLAEIARDNLSGEQPARYSVSKSAAAELTAQKRRAEMARFRPEIDEMNARAREEAMDRPPPATVRAYCQVYGRDPRGWPPARDCELWERDRARYRGASLVLEL